MKTSLIKHTFSMIFVFLFCFIIGSNPNVLRASEPNESTVKEKNITDFNLPIQKHSFQIGPEFYFFDYQEPDGITDKGVFYGGTMNYTYHSWVPDSLTEPLPEGGLLLSGEFRFAAGNADYDGSLTDGTPYKIKNIEYNAYETRFLFGFDVLDEEWIASISTGLGYRYSNDDSSFDPAGYERESNYLYLPLAYRLDSKYENNWAWGFTMEADFLIQGLQKSHMSDVGNVDIENKQNDGFGLRASFRVQKQTQAGVLIIEPFVRYWAIDDSEYKYIDPYLYWEPKNSTTEIGLQLKWQF